jgi:hypothetical protein
MRTLLPALALLTLAACTSTSLLEQWRDPGYAGPPVERLMVVSVERSDGRRRMFEDAMAGTLTRHGVRAEPSYRMLPDSIPEREALSAMARSSGYDGVLMLHSLGTSQSTHYSPGSIQYYPAIRPTLDGKYREYWQAVFQPGASQVEQQLDYQTDLFSAGSGALIWSAASRSIDLTSAQSITMDIANRVVPELRRTGLLRTSP